MKDDIKIGSIGKNINNSGAANLAVESNLCSFPLDYKAVPNEKNSDNMNVFKSNEKILTIQNNDQLDDRYIASLFIVLLHKYFNHGDLTLFVVNKKTSQSRFDQFVYVICKLDGNDNFYDVRSYLDSELSKNNEIGLGSGFDFTRHILLDCSVDQQGSKRDLEEIEFSSIHDRPFLIEFKIRKTSNRSLRLVSRYNSNLIAETNIDCFTHHFRHLFEDIIPQNMSTKMLDLETTEFAERQQLLEDWNNYKVEHKNYSSVRDIFENVVNEYSNKIAIIDKEVAYTYRDLNHKANQIAASLLEKGVQKGDCIALFIERSFNAIAAIVALVKLGVSYSPFDKRMPKSRMFTMLNQLDAKYVIAEEETITDIPVTLITYLTVEDLLNGNLSTIQNLIESTEPPKWNDVLYVLFTSGTTGKPKGVMIEHHSVIRLVIDNNSLPLLPSTKLLQAAALSFDASVFEIWGTLLNGGELIIFPEDLIDFKKLGNYLENYCIDTLWLTSALFDQWILSFDSKLDHLKNMIVGGDRVNPDSVISLYEKQKNIDVYNGYGPTENTTFSMVYKIPRNINPRNRSVPIGTPIRQSSVYILDKYGKMVPVGGTGEIYVGGDGIARGYIDHMELNKEKFVKDRFSTCKSARLYRTGDIGRWLPDGNIDYIGRTDTQVKIRGFRIELQEIESIISNSGFIHSVCVIKIDDESFGSYLVAYYVPNSDESSADKVKKYTKKHLPSYMLPSHFVEIEEIPLNINGKIDQQKLLLPTTRLGSDQYIAPETELEKEICQIWENTLNVPKVGVECNYFTIGGNSILAATVIKLMNDKLGTSFDIGAIFQNQTVKALSSKMKENQEDIKHENNVDDISELKLSLQQKRLWFIDHLENGATIYNIPIVLKFESKVNIPAFQYSLDKIVKRHEVLRTKFVSRGEDILQVITNDVRVPIHQFVINCRDEQNVSRMLDEEYQKELNIAFNLESACKIRSKLLFFEGYYDVVFITIPHIVFDARSVDVFLHELSFYYSTFLRNQDRELPQLIAQYRDYTSWQEKQILHSEFSTIAEKAKNKLIGVPSTHRLPTDFCRNHTSFDYSGDTISVELNKKTYQIFVDLCKKNNISVFMGFLAVYSIMISKYSGENEVVISSPISDRPYSDLDHLIGLFVNTIVYRVSVKEENRVQTFFDYIKQVCLDSYKCRNVPFELLVDMVKPERVLSQNPISQIMLNYYIEGDSSGVLKQIACEKLDLRYPFAKYDLALNIVESNKTLTLSWNYSTSLFKKTTILRMISCFEGLMKSLCENPKLRINELNILSEQEFDQLIHQFNDSCSYFDSDACIHELFESQAKKSPERIALICDGEKLNYGELNARANRLSRFLRDQGVEREELVGLCFERSIDMLVGLIGILKAAAAYVPIDPVLPKTRMKEVIKDSGVRFVLTHEAVAENIPSEDIKILILDEKKITKYVSDNIPISELGLRPSNLAYVIYTSGTTNMPKGVLQSHQNVVRLLLSTEQHFQFNRQDVWTLFHSFAFDFSVWELWGALIYGGLLLIPTFDETRDNVLFYELCQHHGVTVLNQTPSAFYQLAEIACERERLDRLRWVIFGGEALNIEQLKTWWDNYGDQKPQLVNMYGITETTVHTTLKTLSRNDISDISNIGRPLEDVKLYVLNERTHPVPIGVPGELYVGGAGLARGYHHQPELSAEHFIDSPYASKSDIDRGYGRLYKTGDKVRWLADGNLEYLGRYDTQVKIRGFRIELSEIEGVLSSCPGIRQSVVIAPEKKLAQDISHRTLIAYYVPDHQTKLTDSILRDMLAQRLPDYMLPAVYIALEKMPLTINGKLDRKALPEPEFTVDEEQCVAPRNAQEQKVCEIWQELLGVKKIGIRDNFFEIGGDSILSIRIISEMKKLGLQLSIKDIFQYQTIESLIQHFDFCLADNIVAYKPFSLVNLSLVNHLQRYSETIEDIYPASYLQTGMLFESKRAKDSTYHNLVCYKIHQLFNFEKFYSIWCSLTHKHPLLRSAVVKDENYSFVIVQYKKIDMERKIILAGEKTFDQILESEFHQGISLQEAGLFRLVVTDCTEDSFNLTISMHHVIEDGWSFASLVSDFCDLYMDNKSIDNNHILPSYSEFIAKERQILKNSEYSNFWVEYLNDYKPWTGNFLLGRSDVEDHSKFVQVRYHLPNDESQKIKKLSAKLKVSVDTIFLAIYQILLGTFSNKRDIVTGLVVNNRLEQEFGDEVFGLFLNTIPIRVLINSDHILEFIECLYREKVKLFKYKEYPYGKIKSDTTQTQDIYQYAFNYVNFHVSEKHYQSGHLDFVEGYEKTNIPLILTVNKQGEKFTILLKGHSEFIDQETADRFIEYFIDYLNQLLSGNHSLRTIPQQEYDQQLVDWNATDTDFSCNETLHALIEKQALCVPDRTAVLFMRHSLTYQELNHKSNQLARYIRKRYREIMGHSLKPSTLIPLCVDRNLEMIVGIIGVLKSGAAYVPIDPEYPQERIDYILDDVNSPLIVTQTHLVGHAHISKSITNILLDSEEITKESTKNPNIVCSQNDLAYVIYTSGSTGKPKGVLIEHQSVTNMLFSSKSHFDFNCDDKWLAYHSFSFDFSVWEIMGALFGGCTLIIATNEIARDPVRLLRMIKEEQISIINMTPSAFKHTVLDLHDTSCFDGLRYIIFGGEKLSPALVKSWNQKYQNTTVYPKFVNMYGITEITVHGTFYEIDKEKDYGRSSVIGRPLSGLNFYVLDEAMNPLPIGVPGELYISGHSLARGYLNKDKTTKKKFIENPFHHDSSTRLYRTGDLVRWMPDGHLEYFARIDDQVNIRGFRIEPGEIEYGLMKIEAIKDALVLSIDDDHGQKQLIAYLIPHLPNTSNLTDDMKDTLVSEIRYTLSSSLPSYMLPSGWVLLSDWPLTSNGKIDRDSLPLPQFNKNKDQQLPESEIEEKLHEIWSDVFGLTNISVTSSFFELGGTSLTMMKLSSRVYQHFNVEIGYKNLFQLFTIKEQAVFIEKELHHHKVEIFI